MDKIFSKSQKKPILYEVLGFSQIRNILKNSAPSVFDP